MRDLGLVGSAGVVTPGVEDCDKPNKKTANRHSDGKSHNVATQTCSVDVFDGDSQPKTGESAHRPSRTYAGPSGTRIGLEVDSMTQSEALGSAEWLRNWRRESSWNVTAASTDRVRVRTKAEEERAQILNE